MATEINHMTREELISLPIREWSKTSLYRSILILPRNEEHDSGWNTIYIIGLNEEQKPIEIAGTFCDDIELITAAPRDYGKFKCGDLRIDCCLASGAFRFHSRLYSFLVGDSLLSISIEMVLAEKQVWRMNNGLYR